MPELFLLLDIKKGLGQGLLEMLILLFELLHLLLGDIATSVNGKADLPASRKTLGQR